LKKNKNGGQIMKSEKILITGAGSGIGKLTALTLGKIGKEVIATTETERQAALLKEDAKALNIPLYTEKIDITDETDRKKAWDWDVDILVNNAGVSEGGSLVDVPEKNFRNQYEVNVFGTLLFTQGIARQMIKKQSGRIIFITSISGLMANAFSGSYVSSKYALEGIASTLSQELMEFNIEVATVNHGPFLTGFNDEEFERYRNWPRRPEEYTFNPKELSFPLKQFEAKEAIAPTIRVILGEKKTYRNIVPKRMSLMVKFMQKYEWLRRTNWFLGKRHPLAQKSINMEPATRN
jgi:short-subunit dehydrogenase